MTSRFMSRLLGGAAAALALAAGSANAATYELQFTGTDVSGDVFAQTTGSNVTAIWGSVRPIPRSAPAPSPSRD